MFPRAQNLRLHVRPTPCGGHQGNAAGEPGVGGGKVNDSQNPQDFEHSMSLKLIMPISNVNRQIAKALLLSTAKLRDLDVTDLGFSGPGFRSE